MSSQGVVSSDYPRAVPLLRCLSACLSLRMPGFSPRIVHTGFVIGKVALGGVFSEYLDFLLSIPFNQYLCTRSFTHVTDAYKVTT